jgi:hypothetical protein
LVLESFGFVDLSRKIIVCSLIKLAVVASTNSIHLSILVGDDVWHCARFTHTGVELYSRRCSADFSCIIAKLCWVLNETRLAESFLAIIKFKSLKVYIDFLDNFDSTISLRIFIYRLISSHLNQVRWSYLSARRLRIFCIIIRDRWLPVWRRWHQLLYESLVFIVSLDSFILLSVKLLRDKLHEIILGYILHLFTWYPSCCLLHKPLKYFLESILSALLISYIVAKSWLLIELSKRVCSLFEAYF